MTDICFTPEHSEITRSTYGLARPANDQRLPASQRFDILADAEQVLLANSPHEGEMNPAIPSHREWRRTLEAGIAIALMGMVASISPSLNLSNHVVVYKAKSDFRRRCERQAQLTVLALKIQAFEDNEYFPSNLAWKRLELILVELFAECEINLVPTAVFSSTGGISVYFVNEKLERLGIVVAGIEEESDSYFYDSHDQIIGPKELNGDGMEELKELAETLK